MVTFTGADDRTSVRDLERLSAETPWVEWGILSNRRAIEEGGTSLFPGLG